jgi:hypothetical protein
MLRLPDADPADFRNSSTDFVVKCVRYRLILTAKFVLYNLWRGLGMNRKIIIGCSILLAVLGALASQAWEVYRILSLTKDLNELKWDRVSDALDKADAITLNVGTIQFIKGNTFSITLDSVAYNGNGLDLKGHVGNASNLYLSNLTLNFSATKQVYEMRDDYNKKTESDQGMFAIFGEPTIGTAQSSAIASLPPAGQAEFEVTIPNVKQTETGVRIPVFFSGERYSFLP